jgi:hypothetical protein
MARGLGGSVGAGFAEEDRGEKDWRKRAAVEGTI